METFYGDFKKTLHFIKCNRFSTEKEFAQKDPLNGLHILGDIGDISYLSKDIAKNNKLKKNNKLRNYLLDIHIN